MKMSVAAWRQKVQFPPLIALATVPLAVMLTAALAPEALARLWLLPAAYALLAVLCLFVPGRWRLVAGGCSAALLAALGCALLPVVPAWPLAAIPGGYAVLLLTGLQRAAWPRERELSVGWYAAGMALHAAAQLMVNVTRRTGAMPAMRSAEPWLVATFAAFLLLAMLSMNRASMENAGLGRQRAPKSMRRRNALLTVGFLAVVLGIAALPGVVRAIQGLWDLLWYGVVHVVGLLAALLPQPSAAPLSGTPQGGMDFAELVGEASEPAPWLAVLEKVILVLALVIFAGLVCAFVRMLYRRLKVLLRAMRERWSQFSAAASEDYVDEVTDTREEDEERDSLLTRLRRRVGLTDERRLSPSLRIRRRYRLLRRQRGWLPHQTARETLPAAASELYERVRYGAWEADENDALAFEREIRKTKGKDDGT